MASSARLFPFIDVLRHSTHQYFPAHLLLSVPKKKLSGRTIVLEQQLLLHLVEADRLTAVKMCGP